MTSYMVTNGDNQELPSGTQASCLMEHVHRVAWDQTEGQPRTISQEEYEAALACGGEALELVDVTRQSGDDGDAADGSGDTNPTPTPSSGAADDSTQTVRGEAEGTGAGITADEGNDCSPGVKESPKTVVVRRKMPANFLLPNALVFSLFGKVTTSKNRDIDLDLEASNGPPGRTRKSRDGTGGVQDLDASDESSSASASDGKLSRRGLIKLMVGAGESQSRVQAKESLNVSRAQMTSEALQRELIELIKAPDPEQAKLVENVEQISKSLKEEGLIKKREFDISNLRGHISLLEECGRMDEARAAKAQLLALYQAPLTSSGASGSAS